MRDPSGISRGSGFVAFSTPEEASRAVCFPALLFLTSAKFLCNKLIGLFSQTTACWDEWQNDSQQTALCCSCSEERRKKSKVTGTNVFVILVQIYGMMKYSWNHGQCYLVNCICNLHSYLYVNLFNEMLCHCVYCLLNILQLAFAFIVFIVYCVYLYVLMIQSYKKYLFCKFSMYVYTDANLGLLGIYTFISAEFYKFQHLF